MMEVRNEQVVILCGGRGTRLQEETEFKPKALVEIGGKPILWHLMRIYYRHGFRRFVLCLGYKGNLIKQYFLNYSAMQNDFTLKLRSGSQQLQSDSENIEDWEITFADTGTDTNTGGRLSRIRHLIKEQHFLANYCDGLSDLDLGKLVDWHHQKGKVATVTGFHPRSRFGTVKVDKEGIVNYWQEKPLMSDLTSGGFFVFDQKVFDYLDDDCVLEQDPLEKLAGDRQLALFAHEGYWQCMDTHKEALALNQIWNTGNAPWKTW